MFLLSHMCAFHCWDPIYIQNPNCKEVWCMLSLVSASIVWRSAPQGYLEGNWLYIRDVNKHIYTQRWNGAKEKVLLWLQYFLSCRVYSRRYPSQQRRAARPSVGYAAPKSMEAWQDRNLFLNGRECRVFCLFFTFLWLPLFSSTPALS